MTTLIIKPFTEGFHAGISKKPITTCSFEPGTKPHKKWMRGHKRGGELVASLSATHKPKKEGKFHA